uniref:Uncharacterized protein n=1 Tax=Rousettus aegyptiacus TaxID=9407 RepID=A0A7J8B6M5_ROUAE|nr:hypothetical protein HJG63_010455 [Rousettus aegyptiacus]
MSRWARGRQPALLTPRRSPHQSARRGGGTARGPRTRTPWLHTHTCAHTRVLTHAPVCTLTCTRSRNAHAYAHACTCTHSHISAQLLTCMNTHAHTLHTHAHTSTHAHTCTGTHTCMHTKQSQLI